MTLLFFACSKISRSQITPVPKYVYSYKKKESADVKQVEERKTDSKTDKRAKRKERKAETPIAREAIKETEREAKDMAQKTAKEKIEKENVKNIPGYYAYKITIEQLEAQQSINQNRMDSIIKLNELKQKDSEAHPDHFSKNNKEISDSTNEYNKLVNRNSKLEGIKDSLNAQKNLNIVEGRWWSFPIAFNFNRYSYNGNAAKIFNKDFYGKSGLGFIQSNQITRVKGITNITSELVSDYWGTFRWSLYGNISAIDENRKDTAEFNKLSAVQRFSSSGGQFTANIQTPLFCLNLQSGSCHILISGLNKFSIDAIKDGTLLTSAGGIACNDQVGGNFYFDKIFDEKRIGLFIDVTHVYVFGNKPFYNNFTFKDFNVLQGTIGATINGQLKVKFIGILGSSQSALQYSPWQVGLQYSPPISN